ncbi:unnamed protein product [Prorocentrum cordatum]|uniref:Uncharacterized protein n=1 Tax=Prorocentrum cordatum TaxID=2364126 RepID=A0ABN9TY97_9DINO|nr:unnamed protein product [Polarella glacialis]
MHASMRMASTSIFKQKPIVPQENRTNRTTSSRKASCSIVKSFCTTAASRTPLSIVMATSTTGTSTSHFMKKSTTGPCQPSSHSYVSTMPSSARTPGGMHGEASGLKGNGYTAGRHRWGISAATTSTLDTSTRAMSGVSPYRGIFDEK